jgi:glycosyltransferase involved in cell wall biosynthesis
MYAFNGERYIGECIESVLKQTYTDFEFIILDDGSTDKTRTIIEKYMSDSRIRYMYQENIGKTGNYSQLWNTVVRQSTGDLIAFIDQDDLCLPDRLYVQLNEFKSDPSLDVVFSDGLHIDENGKDLGTSFSVWHPQVKTITQWNLQRILFSRNIIARPTTMMRRSSILSMGGFEGGFVADYHFWLKSAPYLRYVYIDKPLIKYRIHSGGASTGQAGENQVVRKTIDLLKNFYQRTNIYDLYPEIKMCSNQGAAIYSAYLHFGNIMLAEATFPIPSIAIHAYKQSMLIDPNRVEALYNLTVAYLVSGNIGQANRCARQLFQLSQIASTSLSLQESVRNLMSILEGHTSCTSGLPYLKESSGISELTLIVAQSEHSFR